MYFFFIQNTFGVEEGKEKTENIKMETTFFFNRQITYKHGFEVTTKFKIKGIHAHRTQKQSIQIIFFQTEYCFVSIFSLKITNYKSIGYFSVVVVVKSNVI